MGLFSKISNWLNDSGEPSLPKVGIKLVHEKATMPAYSRDGDACMDVTSVEDLTIQPNQCVIVQTGIKFQDMPEDYKLCVWSRSGTPVKKNLIIGNGVGTCDENYRGGLGVIMINVGSEPVEITVGEKIAQVSLEKVNRFKFEISDVEVETNRGSGGFGSSGSHR